MHLPLWSAIPATALAALAAWTDVRSRRIPNVLTFPALLLALAAHGGVEGTHGLTSAAVGALLAGGLLVPGWLLGWMGAGDVKLMAALGAWFGASLALPALLATLIAGGLVAVVFALRRGVLAHALRSTALMAGWIAGGATAGAAPAPVTTGVRFPFAVAALAGALVVVAVPR